MTHTAFRTVASAGHEARSPYREPPTRPTLRTRLHYWPGLAPWPVLLIVLLTIPLALLARRDGRVADSVTCHNAPSSPQVCWKATDASGRKGPMQCREEAGQPGRCYATVEGVVAPIACDAAHAKLDELLGEHAAVPALERPFVNAMTALAPIEARPVPHASVTSDLGRAAYFPPRSTRSDSDASLAASWPKPEREWDGSVRPESARALLEACMVAPPGELAVRTVSIATFARDRRGSVAVVVGALVALGLLLARRARVDVEPRVSEVRVTEHVGPFAKRTLVVPCAAVADVVVATGAAGPLVARRVELVMQDGSRLPLLARFAPLSAGAHERVAARLRSALGLRA